MNQTMLDAAGRQTALFLDLFGFFGGVTGFAYLLVIGFLIAAILRRRGHRQDGLPDDGESAENGLRRTLVGWAALIATGLMVLTVASYVADRGLAHAAPEAPRYKIKVTANQWWWDIEYADPIAGNRVRTANELRLPAGVPVELQLVSNDVIHSFWVPSIAGKQDLIPGRMVDLRLLPTKVGTFRGQCAEYCGMQHAHMAFTVRVEPKVQFHAWYRAQLQPAPAPTTALAKAGHDYFMGHQCASCHAIAGTQANGRIAPDLTHVASRPTLAAGTVPNRPGHLYAWIADPQKLKPGTHMPYIGLEPAELDAVVAYLRTLA